MAHTVRYPYHGTLSGGTGTLNTQSGAAAWALAGWGLGCVQGGGVMGFGTERGLSPEARRQQERAIAAARAKQEQAGLLTRPSSGEAAKARLAHETAVRAGRPKWQNSVDVPVPAPGQRRFPPGILMKIPGGLTTDTPPPDMKNLGQWVKSIVAQGIAQQERGGRVLVGWARVAANNGDTATATAYRNGAKQIAAAYAPKRAAADRRLVKMQAEGRAPKDLHALILAETERTLMASPRMMAVQGYGQDAVATAQTVMADWERLAAEDPATGPISVRVQQAAILKAEAGAEATADAATKGGGGGLGLLAAGGLLAFLVLRR
jgi:hypothetical protein